MMVDLVKTWHVIYSSSCPISNTRPLSSRQLYQTNINQCILYDLGPICYQKLPSKLIIYISPLIKRNTKIIQMKTLQNYNGHSINNNDHIIYNDNDNNNNLTSSMSLDVFYMMLKHI